MGDKSKISPATEALIADLWAKGVSATKIGHRIGYTCMGVIYAARRLNLPPSPSPIVRRTAPSAGKGRRVPRPMLDLVNVQPPPPPAAKPVAKLARWSAEKPSPRDERIWQAVVDASRSDAAPTAPADADADDAA